MSYYIESGYGSFISGLYTSPAEAQAAIKRYIAQSSKRIHSADLGRLRQSLKVAQNNAAPNAPDWIADELALEIYLRIAGNNPGTIYTRDLLLGMTRTLIIGTKGEYYEVGPLDRKKAVSKLISTTGPINEDKQSGTLTRTKQPFITIGSGKQGLYKSYKSKI